MASKREQLWETVKKVLDEHSDATGAVRGSWQELHEWVGSPADVLPSDLHGLLNAHQEEFDDYYPQLADFRLTVR